MVAVPVAELANPDLARLHIVAAVLRDATTGPQIEQWNFTQHNETGLLKPAEDPRVVMTTTGSAADGDALDSLRIALASPRIQSTRPVGRAVQGPGPLLNALRSDATIVRNQTADPTARVEALARIVQGLDDAVLVRRRGLSTALDALLDGRWAAEPSRTTTLSKRRTVISIEGPPARQLEVGKKSGGWLVTDERSAT